MSRRLALLIGNSDYEHPALSRLPKPVEDVLGLSDILRNPGIGAFDQVDTLRNPLHAEVSRKIAAFFQAACPDDLLLLYFSGHGVLDDRDEPYLAIRDTDHRKPFGSGIDRLFLTGAMDRSRSRQQVVILDSCYSGDFTRGAKGFEQFAAAFKGNGSGRVILAATNDDAPVAYERSSENDGRYSVFTTFIIEGLTTGAADLDGDGSITVTDLFQYTYQRAITENTKQIPSIWRGNQQGDIVIARSRKPESRLPESIRVALQADQPGEVLSAIDEMDRILGRRDSGALRSAIATVLQDLRHHQSRLVSKAATDCLRTHFSQASSRRGRLIARREYVMGIGLALFLCIDVVLVVLYLTPADGLYLSKQVEKFAPIPLESVYVRGEEVSFHSGRPGAKPILEKMCAQYTLKPGTLLTNDNICVCGELCRKR